MNNYLKYVNATPKNSKGQMILQVVCPVLLAFVFGVLPSVILQGIHKYIAMIMLGISVIAFVVVMVCISGGISTKKNLLCNIVLSINWTFQLILSQLTFFILKNGLNYFLLLLFAPFLVPIFLGLITSKKLRKNTFDIEKNKKSEISISFGVTGMIGMFLAKFLLSDAEQGLAVTIFFLSFTFCACIMSVGLLNIQKLYYLQKYEMSKLENI